MDLYNPIIRGVAELVAPSPVRRFDYSAEGAWEDTGSFELVMLRDAAFELGGDDKPAVNFTCVTTGHELVERDEIQVIGPDLPQLRGSTPYARIALCGWATSRATTWRTRSRPSGPSRIWTS